MPRSQFRGESNFFSMEKKMELEELLSLMREEKIITWFDLGLFIDRFRENQTYPPVRFEGTYDIFKEHLRKGGIAFITYHFMVDGVTMEVAKYASLIRRNIPGIPVHFIAGRIHSMTTPAIREDYHTKVIPELGGFDDWNLYHDFYFTTLERGSETYNALIKKLWEQVLVIVGKLGGYIEKEGINLLYTINVCSNPGNVSLALAVVLISEFLGIPVINNNHDFYWEGGMYREERKRRKLKRGPRDFFFTNYHLGEVFSLVQMLHPWQSRSWINVNINREQTEHIIRVNGHNPASVTEIGTAVDTALYTKNDKRKNIETFLQFERILARYRKKLVCYSVEDVLEGNLVSENNPRPILIGAKTRSVDRFISENIIFLQPTRIISRKRIETSFNLLLKMFEQEEMFLRFRKTSQLKLTFVITGPIAAGHYQYYRKLTGRFQRLLNEVQPELKDRVYLALLFGELDQESFKNRFEEPIGVAELYNIASLILLPSKTEGRGLPIIEATACGTPIFCRRYQPETVYSEVIGEHLGEEDRLKVIEFKGKKINNAVIMQIFDRVFFPHRYTEEIRHNKQVVHKRYSLDALNDNIYSILHLLYRQLGSNEHVQQIVEKCTSDYKKMVHFTNQDLKSILDTRNRQYLAGYGRLAYMNMLKSLIDPSFFREEQQLVRGMTFQFARQIIRNDPDAAFLPVHRINKFYNAVETLFVIPDGETEIRHDHSMSYRHRNRNHYPYQDFTFQELTGLINMLYIRIVQPTPMNRVDLSPQFFTDWDLSLMQLTGSPDLAIDNRRRLIEKLQSNIPMAYFPGSFIMYELEFFALQSIRSRLRLPIEETVTRELLDKSAGELQPIYIFAQEKNLEKQLNKDEIMDYIRHGMSEELKLLYDFRVIRIIRTQQLCVGIHFAQLGKNALKVLRKIREKNGYILTNRNEAAMMTDIVDMDRFHIGKVNDRLTASIMGIPMGSGYIQFVPAGVRTTLSYPVPVQTARDFERALKGSLFKKLKEEYGEEKILDAIREDAVTRGSPVIHVLKSLDGTIRQHEDVFYEYISGVYQDDMPFNGAVAFINFSEKQWDFAAVTAGRKPRTVLQFVKTFYEQTGIRARIAWNGGYILNPELVGKLGLPEAYIGSPLGMIIREGTMIAPPLFNKAALLIHQDGSIEIKRVHSKSGIRIGWKEHEINLDGGSRNKDGDHQRSCYYDLMYPHEFIKGHGRILIRLAGNQVKEVIKTRRDECVPLVPVGLTLALEEQLVPEGLRAGDKLNLSVPDYRGVRHAVEAGPLLLEEGRMAMDMEAGGWKTVHSIRTQAARLDYTDMRGPKIAVGINREGRLAVLTINGRIRESVGATHADMARIMQEKGMQWAMGFDPGGSSTLVVEDRILNISPYNRKYETNPYALPPEPRAVSNAILGFPVKEQ